jgi:hypothetical protein
MSLVDAVPRGGLARYRTYAGAADPRRDTPEQAENWAAGLPTWANATLDAIDAFAAALVKTSRRRVTTVPTRRTWQSWPTLPTPGSCIARAAVDLPARTGSTGCVRAFSVPRWVSCSGGVVPWPVRRRRSAAAKVPMPRDCRLCGGHAETAELPAPPDCRRRRCRVAPDCETRFGTTRRRRAGRRQAHSCRIRGVISPGGAPAVGDLPPAFGSSIRCRVAGTPTTTCPRRPAPSLGARSPCDLPAPIVRGRAGRGG